MITLYLKRAENRRTTQPERLATEQDSASTQITLYEAVVYRRAELKPQPNVISFQQLIQFGSIILADNWEN